MQSIVSSIVRIHEICPEIKFKLVPFENIPENAQEILKNLGQKIVEVDFDAIKAAGLDPTVMLIVTEPPTGDFKINYVDNMEVKDGQVINR